MPEYEYRCKKCEQTFAIERSMSDSSPVNCSHCQSNDLARIWGANFLTGSKNGANSDSKSGSAAGSEMCASDPAKSKSCCPCS